MRPPALVEMTEGGDFSAGLEMTRDSMVARHDIGVISTERSEWRDLHTKFIVLLFMFVMYKNYYVYFMASNNKGALYIGVTNDLQRRASEHKSGAIPGFTQKYHCSNLVYYETFSDVNEAIEREKQLKHWSREKKELLIRSVNPKFMDLAAEW